MKIMPEEYRRILSNINKHVKLDPSEVEIFTSTLKPKLLKPKEFLLQKGDVCRFQSYVLQGCLRTYTIDDSGTEHIVLFSIEDWWASDLRSFFTLQPAKFYIDALEKTRLLQIERYPFDELLRKIPKLEKWLRIIFLNALIASENRIDQHLTLTAEKRFLSFKKKYPDLQNRIAQKHIANYLGITPEFFSMLRKKRSRPPKS